MLWPSQFTVILLVFLRRYFCTTDHSELGEKQSELRGCQHRICSCFDIHDTFLSISFDYYKMSFCAEIVQMHRIAEMEMYVLTLKYTRK